MLQLCETVQNLYGKLAHYHRSQEGRIWKQPPSTCQNFLCSVFVSLAASTPEMSSKVWGCLWFCKIDLKVDPGNTSQNVEFIWEHWESSVFSGIAKLMFVIVNLLFRRFAHRRSYAEIVKLINEIKGEAQEGEGEREVEYSSWMSELSFA